MSRKLKLKNSGLLALAVTVMSLLSAAYRCSGQAKTFNVYSGGTLTAIMGDQSNYYQPTEFLAEARRKFNKILQKFDVMQHTIDQLNRRLSDNNKEDFLAKIKADSIHTAREKRLVDSLTLALNLLKNDSAVQKKKEELLTAKNLIAQSQAVDKSAKFLAETKTILSVEIGNRHIYSFNKSDIADDRDLISVYYPENDEGSAVVKKFNRYGFVDHAGNLIIGFKYEYAENFNNGLALAVRGGKYGFISTDGTEVIPFQYDYALSFRDDKSVVSFKKHWFFLNRSGKKAGNIGDPRDTITSVKYMHNPDRICIVLKEDYAFLADKKGKYIWRFKLSAKSWYTIEGFKKIFDTGTPDVFKAIRQNNKYVLINDKGKVISAEYDSDFNFDVNGHAIVIIKDKTGDNHVNMINNKGAVLLNEYYSTIDDFAFGCYPIKSGKGLWGLLDTSLKVTVKCEYDGLRQLSEQLSLVLKIDRTGSKDINNYGLIDANGFSFVPVYFSKIDFVDGNFFEVTYEKQTSRLELVTYENTVIDKCLTNCDAYHRFVKSKHK